MYKKNSCLCNYQDIVFCKKKKKNNSYNHCLCSHKDVDFCIKKNPKKKQLCMKKNCEATKVFYSVKTVMFKKQTIVCVATKMLYFLKTVMYEKKTLSVELPRCRIL